MEQEEPKKPLPPDLVLGTLSDAGLGEGLHKPPAAEDSVAETFPGTEPLRLPRGGLVVLRQSGGFQFLWRELVVYRSRHLRYRQSASAGGPELIRSKISLAQLAEIHHLLDQIDFSQLPSAPTLTRPDAFYYEIAARGETGLETAEAVQGAIPEALAPLILTLQGLIPPREG